MRLLSVSYSVSKWFFSESTASAKVSAWRDHTKTQSRSSPATSPPSERSVRVGTTARVYHRVHAMHPHPHALRQHATRPKARITLSRSDPLPFDSAEWGDEGSAWRAALVSKSGGK